MRAHVTAMAALVGLVGCADWEEMPEGATAFLVVDGERLEGTVDGQPVEAGSARAEGYCTEGGWFVELYARAGGRDVLQVLTVRDLDMIGRDVSVRFVPRVEEDNELLVESRVASGRLMLQTCAGENTDAPEFESHADDVAFSATQEPDGDVSVEYTATFPNGDQVHGQFSMETPIVD